MLRRDAVIAGSLTTVAARLNDWIEGEDFAGWDPFDALNSPLLKALTFGNRRVGQAWVQAVKRSPVNVRPLLGVPKGHNPKGMGLFLASYWRKALVTGNSADLDRARFFAVWLREHASQGYSGACWGYNFDWPNRGFFAPAGTPTIVNTAFIGLAFLDLIDLGGDGLRVWGDAPLSTARRACDFILGNLNRVQPAPGEVCFSYTPLDQRYVHNANVLGAALLARVAAHTGEPELADQALAAARYTARRQRADGSWLYGEGQADHWVDNFHTAFVLSALRQIGEAVRTDEFDEQVRTGYRFWAEQMFLDDGTPKYYPGRVYPIDVHSAAQAVLTFLDFAEDDPEGLARARKVATWAVAEMQDPAGYFHYQIHARYRIRIPYMRWSQAWMQRALTELAFRGHRGSDGREAAGGKHPSHRGTGERHAHLG